MRRPLLVQKDFEALIGQGEQAQGGSPRERALCVWKKGKKEEEEG
jgi:hypothetical protein